LSRFLTKLTSDNFARRTPYNYILKIYVTVSNKFSFKMDANKEQGNQSNLSSSIPNTKKPTTAANQQKPPKKSSGAGTVIMVILIVGLLGAVGFMVFRDNEQKKVIEANVQQIEKDKVEISTQKVEIKKLEDQLAQMTALADELKLDKDSLMLLVDDVEKLKAEIASGKRTIGYWKRKVNEIKAALAGKQAEMDKVAMERDSAYATIKVIEEEKSLLGDTINQIKKEREDLLGKVEIASVLRAEAIVPTAINSKGKEYPGPLFKGKSIEKLKVSMLLAENKVAQKNSKEIVMRLIEPDGTVLFSGTDGGAFNTADGEEKMYTLSQEVMYSGVPQKVTFVFNKGSEYKKGKHTLEIYAEGHKIGEGTFTVK
jgi:cell division protein ZapB